MCSFSAVTEIGIDDREVFVMSKCPDGEDGENTIATVMEKVASKVALNFTYIARFLYPLKT